LTLDVVAYGSLWAESNGCCRYKLTPHALELNELTPGLEKVLPPTDVRLRPDMRLLEQGYAEKVRKFTLRTHIMTLKPVNKLQDNLAFMLTC
jgi:hypothetical protein